MQKQEDIALWRADMDDQLITELLSTNLTPKISSGGDV